MLEAIDSYLASPVDAAPLALFRVGIAAILLVKLLFLYREHHDHYTASDCLFTFEYLPFIKAPNSFWTHVLLSLEIIACTLVLVGFGHPYSTLVLTLLYAYFFCCDKGRFRNHFYLHGLLIFLLLATQSTAAFSVDAYLGGEEEVPAWQPTIIRLQFLIVFTFGALNKLQSDWLIRHQPLRRWFRQFRAETRFRWQLYRYCGTERMARRVEKVLHSWWAPGLWSWGGFFLDLTVIPMLWYPPTQALGIAMLVGFNLFNQWFFNLGTFPYINYVAIFLFLDPAVSRSLITYLGGAG